MSTGEVQTRAYANTASLIASVIVHYADERGIKIKNKAEICTSYASWEPQHASHSWNQSEYKLIISRGFRVARVKVKTGMQVPQLSAWAES